MLDTKTLVSRIWGFSDGLARDNCCFSAGFCTQTNCCFAMDWCACSKFQSCLACRLLPFRNKITQTGH